MTATQWLLLAASLIGGGAMGALINMVVTSLRNRQQPVGKRVDIINLFKDTIGDSSLKTMVTVSDGNAEYRYSNLFIGDVLITNRGNKDIEAFKFGITLDKCDNLIYALPQAPDRHHKLEVLTEVSPSLPKNDIDFLVTPFNREDSYTIRLYITVPDAKDKPSSLQFSSPHPIRFSEMPTVSETISEIAISTVLSIGPLTLSTRNFNR